MMMSSNTVSHCVSKSTSAFMYDWASCSVSYFDSFLPDAMKGTAARSWSNASFNIVIRRRSRAFATSRLSNAAAAAILVSSPRHFRSARWRNGRRRRPTSGLAVFGLRSDGGLTGWWVQLVAGVGGSSDEPSRFTTRAEHAAFIVLSILYMHANVSFTKC